MSISFPIKYNAEDSNNSVMTKYYQLDDGNSVIHLEKDICLRHMLQQNPNEIDYTDNYVVYESAPFAENLSIEDPNCSISNPTAFCIAAKYVQQTFVEENPANPIYSHTVVIGTNNFGAFENEISTQIELAIDNSPIFDTNLLITISDNNESFYSVDVNKTIIATFDSEDSNILLSKAINSAYNTTDNLSLLTFGEDIVFNNTYALGKLQTTYFTKDLTTYELKANTINTSYLASENNVTIEVTPEKIGQLSFGTFKIKIEEAKINEDLNGDAGIKTTFLIGDNVGNTNNIDISEASQLSKYLVLFNDISSGNSFKIMVTDKNENSGLNFETGNNGYDYFAINNATMIPNIEFMEKIIFEDMSLNVVLSQEPMTITVDSSIVNGAIVAAEANKSLFGLTENGETLGVNDYDKDGEIILEIDTQINRVNILSGDSAVYSEIRVEYNKLHNELKINKDVEFNIVNTITPTGTDYYSPLATDNGTKTSLFINGETASVTIVAPNIVNGDNEITLIKINPSSTLTNDIGGNILYELNDTGVDNAIDAVTIDVTISGTIDIFKDEYDLRYLVYPKTIDELDISSPGLNGKNNIKVLTTSLPEINDSVDKNTWLLGYRNADDLFVKTNANTFSSITSYFPTGQECSDIINNNVPLNVIIKYETASNIGIFYDKVTILCNGSTYTVTQNDIIFKMKNNFAPYYNRPYNKVIGGTTYQVVEEVKVEVYNSIIHFNLAGTTNLSLMSPLLKSTVTNYYIYSNTTTFTGFTDGQPSTLLYTATSNAINLPQTVLDQQELKAFEIIRLEGDETTEAILNFQVKKATVTSLNAQIQSREDKEDTTWADIGPKITDIEPYLGTNPVITTNELGVKIETYMVKVKNTNRILIIDKPFYFTPLVLDYTSVTGNITGFRYNTTNMPSEFNTNFNPNNYTTSSLPDNVGDALNLSSTVTYGEQDLNQGGATYRVIITVRDLNNPDTNTNTIAVVTIEQPNFNKSLVIAKINKHFFKVNKKIGTNATETQYITTREYDNIYPTTGLFNIPEGLQIYFTNIKQNDFVNFKLRTDKIAVNLVKNPLDTANPDYFESLTFTREGCEKFSIPYYRGYTTYNIDTTVTYKYIINRKNLVSCVINANNDDYQANFDNGIYVNYQNVISFNNNIRSIGTKIVPNFSRLAKNKLTNNKLVLDLMVVSDEIEITRSTNNGNNEPVTKLLKDFKLYNFVNGQILKANCLRVLNNTLVNDFYRLEYNKSNTLVYYNNKYIGNPQQITEWKKIVEKSFGDSKDGFYVNELVENVNGFLYIKLTENSKTNSESFIVIACPHLKATQMGIDGVKQFLINKTDTSIYDKDKLVTKYIPIFQDPNNTTILIDKVGIYTNYYPFAGTANVNNVEFKTIVTKAIHEYGDSTKNVVPIHFKINGSNIVIKEINVNNVATNNGPNGNGVIFNGTINDLISLPGDNIYRNYISLVLFTNGQLKLSYTQDKSNIFEAVFGEDNSNIDPTNNIKFIVGNCFLPAGTYKLVSSIAKGTKVFVYDMVKRETDTVLLKYEMETIDFTNLPTGVSIEKLVFAAIKIYKSVVSFNPIEFGKKYGDRYSNIIESNMALNNSEIVWTEITSQALIDNFSLIIRAINTEGLNNIIEMMYATSDIPLNFTVFKLANTMEILASDGTPKFIITPFGQIQTPSINSKDLSIYDLSLTYNSNVEIIKSGVTILNALELTLTVTTSSGKYIIDGSTSPELNFIRGNRYILNINTSGHPFYFQTSGLIYNESLVYTNGVTNSGTQSGTIIFEVPYNAPNELTYVCEYHGNMGNKINISDF